MKVSGPIQLVGDVQQRELCIGCGACVDLCPYFRNHRGKTVQLFPCNLEQGRCFAACPKAEVDLNELALAYWREDYRGTPLGRYEEVFAARAGHGMPRGRFQGGGTVSALMVQALREGRVEAAVLTGGEMQAPVPRLAVSPEDVLSCAGSKFAAAPTLAALNRAAGEGRKSLGVVGTPCQVIAVAKMRLNLSKQEGFVDPVSLVVGLFCNWSFDQRRLGDFLAGRVDPARIKGMDIPPPPAESLVLDLGTEKVEIRLDEIRKFIHRTCFVCPDLTAEWADVSVGMFEGHPGWNTLIVRSAKGRELVGAAVTRGLLETAPLPVKDLNALKEAAAAKKQRAFRAARDNHLLDTDDSGRGAMLRVPDDVLKEFLSQPET